MSDRGVGSGSEAGPLLSKIDAIEIHVPSLDEGLGFYRDRLGHGLIWRREGSAGLRMPNTDAELVLQSDRPGVHIDFLVPDADEAAARFAAEGGTISVAPFDIPIGRCAVVEDPWGNRLVLLDMRNGLLETDGEGNVVESPAQ